MEVVTVKFQEKILKKIDKKISECNYNSRTEFLREAVREKLEKLSHEEIIKEFMKLRGKSKIKTTYEQDRKTKWIASKELMAELDKRFS